MDSSAGTVQSTSILASPYDGIEGRGSLTTVPSGVVTCIVVADEDSKPRFCVGIENDNKSPGNELYPIDLVSVDSTPSLVRVTMIASD